jgi:hypothetical protein
MLIEDLNLLLIPMKPGIVKWDGFEMKSRVEIVLCDMHNILKQGINHCHLDIQRNVEKGQLSLNEIPSGPSHLHAPHMVPRLLCKGLNEATLVQVGEATRA